MDTSSKPGAALDSINAALLRQSTVDLAIVLEAFYEANIDTNTSPNLVSVEIDDLRGILDILGKRSTGQDSDLLLLLLRVFKILLRKPINRVNIGKKGVNIVAEVLRQLPPAQCACECANVVLNMCYEAVNARYFIGAGGLTALLPMVRSADWGMQASGLGALQSLCYERYGRDRAREEGLIALVAPLLCSPHLKVRERALGCIHNMSADASSISDIRQSGAIPGLITMLRSPIPEVCAGASGTIQNVSRDVTCRDILLASGVVEHLSDLLVGCNTECAISAAGALLNIIGPDMTTVDERELLKACLADGIVLGALRECMT